jgi:outer membrane protein OmpA-like peptidoglycan-associated protein
MNTNYFSSLALAGAVLFGGQGVLAQAVAPITSPAEFVNAIQGASNPTQAATPAVCPSGYPKDDEGLCPAVSEGGRGFSLFDNRAAPTAHPAAPHVVRVASVVPHRVAAPSSSTSHGALSDLLITFKLGSAELTPQGEAQATSFARALQTPAVAQTRFEIAGHTDVTGTEQVNQALSQARADTVKNYLVAHGVDPARVEAKGYGSQRLIDPSSPRDPANRRVEARLLN